MSELILKYLDAMAAQMTLALAQIDAARHAVALEQQAQTATPAPVAEPPPPPLPEQCAGIPPDQCALRDEHAKTNLMGGVAVCHGCRARLGDDGTSA